MLGILDLSSTLAMAPNRSLLKDSYGCWKVAILFVLWRPPHLCEGYPQRPVIFVQESGIDQSSSNLNLAADGGRRWTPWGFVCRGKLFSKFNSQLSAVTVSTSATQKPMVNAKTTSTEVDISSFGCCLCLGDFNTSGSPTIKVQNKSSLGIGGRGTNQLQKSDQRWEKKSVQLFATWQSYLEVKQ